MTNGVAGTLSKMARSLSKMAASSTLVAGYARPAAAAAVAATGLAVLLRRSPEAWLGRPLAPALAFGLLVLALGVRSGKRRSGDLAAGLLLAAAAIGALRGCPPGRGIAEACLAMLLLAIRPALPATNGAPVRRWGIACVAALAVSYALATATLLVSDRAAGLGSALAGSASWLVAGGAWLKSGAWLAIALDALVVASLLVGVIFVRVLLQPALAAVGHTTDEHARAAAIVAAHGRDSLDPFALRDDKSFHFAAGGVLAYRTLRETAVVSGDPIGPPGCAAAVMASFEAFAAARGWQVVVTGASGRHLAAFGALGLSALCIGEEAVVDARGFSLEGRPIRKVRQSVTRLARHGWRIEAVDAAALDPRLCEEIATVDLAWRGRHRRLSGFAMTLGRLWGADEDRRGLYVLARDSGGELRAFLRFASYTDGLSLDATRRIGDEPNGLTEAMVVAALAYARERDIAEVSLNFAGFAHVMAAHAATGHSQRLLRIALRALHGRFQLERLVRFSNKFGPTWRPRYLIHRGRISLPLAALRVLQAEAYVRPPKSRPLTARWQPDPAPAPLLPGARQPFRPAATR